MELHIVLRPVGSKSHPAVPRLEYRHLVVKENLLQPQLRRLGRARGAVPLVARAVGAVVGDARKVVKVVLVIIYYKYFRISI